MNWTKLSIFIYYLSLKPVQKHAKNIYCSEFKALLIFHYYRFIGKLLQSYKVTLLKSLYWLTLFIGIQNYIYSCLYSLLFLTVSLGVLLQ